MNLKFLNDEVLVVHTVQCVREENEALTRVLHHLREINQRRLFSSLGYKSLFDFAVRKLGYSEDQAYRRISALKLLQEIPELEQKISSGQISLAHIGIAQSHFRQERKIHHQEMTSTQKISVLNKIAKKPIREAERITLSLSSAPELEKPDRVQTISESRIELKFTASAGLQAKIDRIKGLLAHQNPNLSLGELFEKLCDLGISEWSPSKTAAPRKRRVIKIKPSAAQVRRDVFQKAKHQCENCGSWYALEIDHIRPKALSGDSSPENLRVLCRSCNQRAAIKVFGQQKMDFYLKNSDRSSFE